MVVIMTKIKNELPVVEIFESIQGEGFNTGKRAIFIRLGRCNLRCPWCDTNYDQFDLMSFEEIFLEIIAFSDTKNVVITGGEPTVHKNLSFFIEKLKVNSYTVWIESNGIREIPKLIDYIAISPKRLYRNIYEKQCVFTADEVRIVIDDKEDGLDFCQFIEKRVKSKRYFISPCEIDNEIQWADALHVLAKLNERHNRKVDWFLSIQTHKMMDIR